MSHIHVVAHTHWDQEWYFTLQDSNILASYNFAEVIATLEQDPSYTCYHLDGQMAVVEDFLGINPEYRQRLNTLVRDKRLFIGPWYSQTDTYNVHGESIIRNLKYGMLSAREHGHAMMVGYLPDTFGHNAQMPTLLRGCGIDNIVFWRGINHDEQASKSQFIWRAPSGAEIIACAMAFGYGAAKNISADAEHLHGKIYPLVNALRQRAGLEHLLLPSGGDQVNIDPDLPGILRTASQHSPENDQYRIGSLEHYVGLLRQRQGGFERWEGELKSPRYTRIHKTIGSVRYDIKKKNYDIEQFILRRLEPTIALARHHGIHVNLEWVDRIWKQLLRCHAHDSIGGCNSDATNRDIAHRLEQTEQLCHSLWNLVVKELGSACCQEGELLVVNTSADKASRVVNTTVYSRSDTLALRYQHQPLAFSVLDRQSLPGGRVVQLTPEGEKEIVLPDYYRWNIALDMPDLPALGYMAVTVAEAPGISDWAHTVQDTVIENETSRLRIEAGYLSLEDKHSGRRIEKLFTFEDCADAGDSYDFSPLKGDTPQYTAQFRLLDCQKCQLIERMTLETELLLPVDQAARAGGATKTLSVRLQCELRKYDPHLYVAIDLENTVCDHRLRLLINSDITTRHTLASQPFSIIRRQAGVKNDRWRQQYREFPVDIETSEGIIAVEDAGKALIINSQGMKEFQLHGTEPAQVALTLFKATGVLGRDDLAWRPGRASGINNTIVETPDAQLLKPLHFSFALSLADNAEHATLRKREKQAIGQPFTWQRQTLHTLDNRLERFTLNIKTRSLPGYFSLLDVPEPLILSALPHAQTVNGTLVRLFNAGDQPVPVPACFTALAQVNYLEEIVPTQTMIPPSSSCDFLIAYTERNDPQ